MESFTYLYMVDSMERKESEMFGDKCNSIPKLEMNCLVLFYFGEYMKALDSFMDVLRSL